MKKLIIANWKLNGNKNTINKLVYDLQSNISLEISNNIVIAPPLVYLDFTRQLLLKYDSKISLAAQNVDINLHGPFTGETSVLMLKDIGVKYAIVGHSERKIHHLENDIDIIKKLEVLISNDLTPILCIGENITELSRNKTIDICIKQINNIIKHFGIYAFKRIIIAYEPTWAIGRNKTADPLKVCDVFAHIRRFLSTFDKSISDNAILQYGGSIDNRNIVNFLKIPYMDGILIGGSSLHSNIFIDIIKLFFAKK